MKIEMPHGRKLPSYLENPVDNFLIAVSSKLRGWFRWFGVTPNQITMLSGCFQVYALIRFAKGDYTTGAVLWSGGYLFDVMDGYFARYYAMVSDIGDILDHGKDLTVGLALLYTTFVHNGWSHDTKTLFYTGYAICMYQGYYYLRFQELFVKKNREGRMDRDGDREMSSKSLSLLIGEENGHGVSMDECAKKLYEYKWWGPGTLNLFIVLMWLYGSHGYMSGNANPVCSNTMTGIKN